MARNKQSGIYQFVIGYENEPFYIVIDVHKQSYHIALRRVDGRVLSMVSHASPQAIAELLWNMGISIGAVAHACVSSVPSFLDAQRVEGAASALTGRLTLPC